MQTLEQTQNESSSEFNFLYERLIQIFENHAFTPLEFYTTSEFKKCDKMKILDDEETKAIKNVFNNLRTHYIDQIKEEIKSFVEKYNLKEKLELKSRALFYNMLIEELGLSLKDLEELEEINNLENDESSVLKYYVHTFIQDKNKELELENEKLREELKLIKARNNLNLEKK